jgi:pimeloyl-ACP methyl ester carboxylesterase
MDISTATQRYEAWMRRCTRIVEGDLRDKHRHMREDLFLFFRGTFYRWAQLFPAICRRETSAPRVVAVGDLHVGSFGTWRDSESRLAWGVDDFDDAYPLPYTNDLIRLASSVRVCIDAGLLSLSLREGCDAILEGYATTIKAGGCALVFAEAHDNLRRFGFEAIEPPTRFWRALEKLPRARRAPSDVRAVLTEAMPEAGLARDIRRRTAGLGSLGQPRFVALGWSHGGLIAREAKELIPSSVAWAVGDRRAGQPFYERALANAIRSPDPTRAVSGRWLVRRLLPDATRIEIANLPNDRDEERLLYAMGTETANVHLGSRGKTLAIARDLRGRKAKWLRRAGNAMAKAVEHEWRRYRRI